MTTLGCDAGRSGISRALIELLRHFPQSDPDTEFEALVFPDEEGVFLQDSARIRALHAWRLWRTPVLNVAWHQAALPVWCLRQRFDVLLLAAANRRVPLAVPCPTVGIVHDLSSVHVAGKYDPARSFYIRRVLPKMLRCLTRIITVSESSKRDIVEYGGISESRITVVPWAADATFSPRVREEAQERLRAGFGIRSPYLLYVARIEHPGKNHARLIRTFGRLKADLDIPHQLVLAGSDWFRAEEVHKEASLSAFSQDILFPGFVPDEDLPDLYCGADLLVFPSLYEGFGIPILEAMQCGTPVVSSNTSSMPEVGGDAAVYFDPLDEGAIAEAIRTPLEDPALRDRMSTAGKERATLFTWPGSARKTLEVMHQAT